MQLLHKSYKIVEKVPRLSVNNVPTDERISRRMLLVNCNEFKAFDIQIGCGSDGEVLREMLNRK